MDEHNKRYPMLWLLIGTVVLAVLFASYFEIDEQVRARGQIITDAKTQVIQAVDGGMLISLPVHEGERVTAGQVLAELETDRAQAGMVQADDEFMSKSIAVARSRAELAGHAPVYDEQQKARPDLIAVQNGIYAQRLRGMNEELGSLSTSLSLAKDELKMHETLYSSGDISKAEVMRSQRQVIEINARRNNIRNKYMQDASAELAKLSDDLSNADAKRKDRENILKHTVLRSPMDGIVKSVRVTTLGGVLRAGDELMQISPVEDELIAEVKINPADVGQLKTKLPVTLRFDAFDSSVYGNVEGTLLSVSPDTLTERGPNDSPMVYYRAEIIFDTQHNPKIKNDDFKPGMQVTADIKTGRRTLIYYLAKPIVKAFSGALSER